MLLFTGHSVPRCQSAEWLQPIKMSRKNIPRKKPEEWPPCLPRKLKCCNRAQDTLQHQRMGIPAHARTAHNGPLQKSLERDLCWIVPHVPPTTRSVKGMNWTELKDGSIPSKTFTISNGVRSLIPRDISANQIRQIIFIKTLDSDSNHRAFHQTPQ